MSEETQQTDIGAICTVIFVFVMTLMLLLNIWKVEDKIDTLNHRLDRCEQENGR